MNMVFFSLHFAKFRTDLCYSSISFPPEAMKKGSPAATTSFLEFKTDSSNKLEYKRKPILINSTVEGEH